jgi:hypothetical protein
VNERERRSSRCGWEAFRSGAMGDNEGRVASGRVAAPSLGAVEHAASAHEGTWRAVIGRHDLFPVGGAAGCHVTREPVAG